MHVFPDVSPFRDEKCRHASFGLNTSGGLAPHILLRRPKKAMMEADRDREMVDEVVKKIEAEEQAEQEQYLRNRCSTGHGRR